MAEVGSSYLTIIPKFKNLKGSIDDALGAVGGQAGAKAGERIGSAIHVGVKRGTDKAKQSIVGIGAAIGAMSSVTSAAMSSISSHLGSAVSRLDTLKNYPRVMQALGFSAFESSQSIQTMDDRLKTLPTRLDDMTNTVKGLAVITKDLDLATDAGLALNDMLLASGSNQMICNAAMEQFRQMLAKGKPDMQDWKSLVQAMPGQLDQLAKSMLGPTATANDLYFALGGGGKKATISMEDLLKAMVKLDKEGGQNITSFKEQAEEATKGVGTSTANMENAITKGITAVMDAIGQERISGVMNTLRDSIKQAFNTISEGIRVALPLLEEYGPKVLDIFSNIAPPVIASAGSFKLLAGASKALKGAGIRSVGDALAWTSLNAGKAGLAIKRLFTAHPLLLAISGAVAVLTPLLKKNFDSWVEAGKLEKAVRGFNDAMKDTTSALAYTGGIKGVGKAATQAKAGVEDLREATERHTRAIRENFDEAKKQLQPLGEVVKIIDEYTGKTDLNAEAQGKVSWAIREINKQLGLNISKQDVATGKYKDQNGVVHNLKDSIYELIEAKKREIIAAAQAKTISELYQKRAEDIKRVTEAQDKYNEKVKNLKQIYADAVEHGGGFVSADPMAEEKFIKSDADLKELKKSLDNAKQGLHDTEKGIRDCNEAMGDMQTSTGFLKNVLETLGGKPLFKNLKLDSKELAKQLEQVGVKSSDLERIGSQGFSQLATACKGNIKQIVAAIKNYNGVKLLNKDGKIVADSSMLVDAQGKVYEWNGTELVSKETGAKADVTEVVDATGHVLEWDGTKLVNKAANAAVEDSGVVTATDDAQKYQDTPLDDKYAVSSVDSESVRQAQADVDYREQHPPKDQYATTVIDNITNFFRNIFTHEEEHAAGGIRYHAQGAVVTRAMPLDIVGEDGAEAIVPLTNRQYSQPFADIIAEGVTDKLGSKNVEELSILHEIAGLLRQLNAKDNSVYMDGGKISETLAQRSRALAEGRGYVYG